MSSDRLSSTILVKEHETILKVIDALDRKIEEFREGNLIDVGFLRSLLEFSRVFIDKCHHGKEELCLFPCLERRGIPRENGPIGVMLMEHEMGRSLVRQINERLDSYVSRHSKTDFERILNLCSEYIELLRQHIYKENNILFPMGDGVIDEDDERRNIECYEKREHELGEETHHRMEQLAERLKQEAKQ